MKKLFNPFKAIKNFLTGKSKPKESFTPTGPEAGYETAPEKSRHKERKRYGSGKARFGNRKKPVVRTHAQVLKMRNRKLRKVQQHSRIINRRAA